MKSKRKIIYLAGFLFSVPLALTSYINSSYLKEFISEYEVGILYTVASILAIIFLFRMPKILTKYGNKKFIIVSGLITLFSIILIAFSKNPTIISLSFVLFFIGSDLILASLDIFVEDFSTNKSVGRFRGTYLTFVNLAWVVSQMISGSIINKSSFSGIYLFSSLFIVLMIFVFMFLLKDFRDPVYKKVSLWRTMKSVIKSSKISKIYLIYFILKFFFAWMIIYTPIYLNQEIGFHWDEIGIIFSIMLLPFVILTFPLGKLSDKVGEKKMLIIGFIISSIFTFFIPFIGLKAIWIFALVLFMTRVGAAAIEAMSEIYFFRIVSERDADIIAFFKNTYPLSFVVAPVVATLVLYLVPHFSYLYPILSAILLIGLILSLRLKDVR